MKRVLLGVAVVVLALGGALAWWTSRSEAPAALSIDGVEAVGGVADVAELDGTWRVEADPDTIAGMRILEERAGAIPDHTAVGRTGEVTGSLEVAGGAVTSGSFTVDLTSIEFTDDPGLPVADRSAYLRTRALETDDFPEATFELTEPIALDDLDEAGAADGIAAVGTLVLHGVDRPMTIAVDVRAEGDRVVLATSEPVAVRLPDHDIEPPEIPGVATVTDEGSFEFVVVLRRA